MLEIEVCFQAKVASSKNVHHPEPDAIAVRFLRMISTDKIMKNIPKPGSATVTRRVKTMAMVCGMVLSLLWSHPAAGQPPRIVGLKELKDMMAQGTAEIHIVNFWATWCGPCIKELPYFEQITAKRHAGVKVILVSLDLDLDPDPEKVYQFVSRRNLRSQVVILEAGDPNTWIDAIEEKWSGSLPATILINHRTGERKFIDRALREGELEAYVQALR